MVKYEGVRLIDVLMQAGVTFGQTMRGPRLASFVVAGSPDGFKVVIALAEIDPDFANRDAIVADRLNGAPLSMRDGPLQLIIPADTHHARWVRNSDATALTDARLGTAGRSFDQATITWHFSPCARRRTGWASATRR